MSARYDCILPCPGGERILLVRERGRCTLPHVECEQGWIAQAVAEIHARFRERYGLDVAVLREIESSDVATTCEVERIAPTGGDVPGEWFRIGDPLPGSLSPQQAQTLRRWCAGEGAERDAAPWQRPGWFDGAREWILDRVRGAGLHPNGPVLPVKGAWNGSCVLKVQTSAGACWFKASPRRTPGEIAILRALSARWARHVPVVLDADDERNWVLMPEIAGEPLDCEDPRALSELARLVARIQIDQAGAVDAWRSMGCPDRGLDALSRRAPRLLVEIPGLLLGAGVLSAREREEIASFVPQAQALCRELSAFSIPAPSIHHEDLRDGNVLRAPDGNLVIIDWNDLVIAHPFFTLQRFLWFMDPPRGGQRHRIGDGVDDAPRRELRDAYLQTFEAFEPRERLLQAFELSCALSPIYDLLRFDCAVDVDAVVHEGMDDDEKESARECMDEILEVRRWSPG